jgi:hypothetical protein
MGAAGGTRYLVGDVGVRGPLGAEFVLVVLAPLREVLLGDRIL